MVGCYLTSLPREFMRSMAGHPSQMGCFEVPRASVAPPDALLSMIWPELDAWKGRFGPQPDQVNDLAAMGVTDLLFYFREVIVQDSVVLRPMFPSSPVWAHPVFQHEAYEPFARNVEACLREESPNQLSVLYQAMPQLVDSLNAINARICQIEQNQQRNEQRSEQRAVELQWCLQHQIEAQQAQLSRLLPRITSGGITFPLPSDAAGSDWPVGRPGLPPPPPLELPPPPSALSPLSGPPPPALSSASSTQPTRATPTPQPPVHCMSRAVKTVEHLWREWTVGLHGSPSILALDARWGSQWRTKRQSEQQWYSLRREVITEVKRIARSRRIGEEAAMWQVHQQQQQVQCSLDQFCKRLRAGRKARDR